MSLKWLACIIVVTGVSVWIARYLLESRRGFRNAVQIAMIFAALFLIILGFLHGVHFRSR